MATNLIEARDALSQKFGELQGEYNKSLAGFVEAYGTAISALESISNAQALSLAQKTAKAALARVGTSVTFTSDPTYALRQEEIDAQTAHLPQQQAQAAPAPQPEATPQPQPRPEAAEASRGSIQADVLDAAGNVVQGA